MLRCIKDCRTCSSNLLRNLQPGFVGQFFYWFKFLRNIFVFHCTLQFYYIFYIFIPILYIRYSLYFIFLAQVIEGEAQMSYLSNIGHCRNFVRCFQVLVSLDGEVLL